MHCLLGYLPVLRASPTLDLGNHAFLSVLQAGVFDGLTNLEILRLDRLVSLTTLPAGLFDGLMNLTELNLASGGLDTLPDGVFDNPYESHPICV